MLYLDTSLVVPLVAVEPSTAIAHEWLATHGDDELIISDWVITEVASALSIIRRVGGLDDDGHAKATDNLERLWSESLTVLPVSRQAFRAAAAMAGRPQLRLRAGDALHVAVAEEHGAELATRDIAQAAAARQLGLSAEVVAGDPGDSP